MRREDIAWSHYHSRMSTRARFEIYRTQKNRTMGTLSLSNASLTGFAVRVAGVEGVSGVGSSAIVR